MKCVKCGFDPKARVLASWEVFIERDPPSLNERVFNSGPRAYLYRQESEVWGWEMRHARLNQKIPKAKTRRRVTFERHYGGRQKERDHDNFVGGIKAVVDAMTMENLIVADDSSGVELHYAQQLVAARGARRGLRILIEEVA